jgi:hypothetical protein
MQKRIIIIAWILMTLAFVAWAMVGYGANAIVFAADARAKNAKIALTKANQTALNQRVAALAQSTQEKREELSNIINTDLVQIINTIESVGASVGVQTKVSDAAPSASVFVSKTESLRGITFSVQTEGTFAQMMRTAHLYENLPLLSAIDNLEIERVQRSGGSQAPWAMVIRIKVFTGENVSI